MTGPPLSFYNFYKQTTPWIIWGFLKWGIPKSPCVSILSHGHPWLGWGAHLSCYGFQYIQGGSLKIWYPKTQVAFLYHYSIFVSWNGWQPTTMHYFSRYTYSCIMNDWHGGSLWTILPMTAVYQAFSHSPHPIRSDAHYRAQLYPYYIPMYIYIYIPLHYPHYHHIFTSPLKHR